MTGSPCSQLGNTGCAPLARQRLILIGLCVLLTFYEQSKMLLGRCRAGETVQKLHSSPCPSPIAADDAAPPPQKALTPLPLPKKAITNPPPPFNIHRAQTSTPHTQTDHCENVDVFAQWPRHDGEAPKWSRISAHHIAYLYDWTDRPLLWRPLGLIIIIIIINKKKKRRQPPGFAMVTDAPITQTHNCFLLTWRGTIQRDRSRQFL